MCLGLKLQDYTIEYNYGGIRTKNVHNALFLENNIGSQHQHQHDSDIDKGLKNAFF
jgi:hypothetical protein